MKKPTIVGSQVVVEGQWRERFFKKNWGTPMEVLVGQEENVIVNPVGNRKPVKRCQDTYYMYKFQKSLDGETNERSLRGDTEIFLTL